jgi:hydrogenase expression/formation protein HypE
VAIKSSDRILLSHGAGGKLAHELVEKLFLPRFANPALECLDDGAVLGDSPEGQLAVSTDCFVVDPIFFPGGDIGRLAICGTVNDVAMTGAVPRWLTAGFILEEGLPIADLTRIVDSMAATAEEAGVGIVAGDTKVVPRGHADKIFINTAGIGWRPHGVSPTGMGARPGDAILASGTLGDHEICLMTLRAGLTLDGNVDSDVAPVNGLVRALVEAGIEIHALRDPTRGGTATVLNEIASSSGVAMRLHEDAIPLRPGVRGACEIMGFDPLYLASEGKMIVVLPEAEADPALEVLRALPYGEEACRMGEVIDGNAGQVTLRTSIGGERIVDMLTGEMLPRIC